MSATLLCVGDLHLGRRFDRVPSCLDPRELGPDAAWAAAVEHASELEVDAVLLAGDVVEEPGDFYEAYPHLERGSRRLLDAGIAVFAVAGNHDTLVLPRLAELLPGVRLLGRDGTWESASLHRGKSEIAHIVGWSFPKPDVAAIPLERLPRPCAGAPTIGLLHCDRDRPRSPHGYVRTNDLERADFDAWFLGHIHEPCPLSGPRPLGYLGSLVGLDRTERGWRGPWLARASCGRVDVEPLATSPLRRERVRLRIEEGTGPAELRASLAAALEHAAAGVRPRGKLRALACSVEVEASRRTLDSLEAELRRANGEEGGLYREVDGLVVFSERVTCSPRAHVDLQAIARGEDPAGILARMLLSLDRESLSTEGKELLAELRSVLAEIVGRPAWAGLDPERQQWSDAELVELLSRAGEEILAEWIA